MATTSRTKNSAMGKEKRGTSPSLNSQTSSQRSSSRQGRSDNKEKPIPNYLKPTISSRPESQKLLKKNSADDKEKLLRRRSFDKPPSSSPRAHRGLTSPGQRDRSTGTSSPAPVVPRERKLIVRSSSFSGKSVVSSPKPVGNKDSKTPKGMKSQPVFSKVGKKESIASPNRKDYCNAFAPSSSKASSQDSTETLDREDKEIVKVESEPEVNSYVTKSENGEESLLDAVDTEESNNGEVEKIKPSDMATCTSEDRSVHQAGKNEETDMEKTDTQQEESAENYNLSKEEESCNGCPNEIVTEEVKAKAVTEIEEKDEDRKIENENTISAEEIGDEKKMEEKDEEAGSEGVKGKEGQELEIGDGDEGKVQERETANAAASETQGGKKESPTAYNDVIEETASKLLEKRKNKVKALVGAFETVIDYESGGSK